MATNVAASANGGTATASSEVNASYLASFANDGDRTGAVWGVDGGWNDGTAGVFDDWLQIDFNASYAISEIDVFGLQDNYASPSTPTLGMTSSLYGLTDFDVQYWNGSTWVTVTGGAVTGNNKVWVQLTFTPVTTTKIRVLVHATQDGLYSRIAEFEAWTAVAAPSAPNTPSPANAATGVSLTPTMTWVAAGATSYDVYLGTAGSPPLVNAGQAGASYMPAALAGSTTYFWKIVAINGSGSTTGSVWSFTTGAFSSVVSLKPTIFVDVELNGAGGGWTTLSDVLRDAEVTINHGIDGSAPRDLVAGSGTARYALNNSTRNSAGLLGYYSLYHANKRTGWALGINCRIRLQDPTTGTYYTRFIGRIDSIDPVPGRYGARAVDVTATDWMDEAARWALTPEVGEQVGKRADEILTAILAQMPRQPTATSFDAGTEAYPYALDTSSNNQQPALSEFAKLAASEFGPIYQKADGTFRFENRHARLLTTTSVWTLTDADLSDLRLPSTRDEIINVVRVTEHPKLVDTLPTTLIYDQTNTIEVAAGDTKFLLGPYRDPVTGDPIGATDVQAQVPGVDYQARTMEDGTGTDISSDFVVTVTAGAAGASFSVVNNNAGTGFLTVNRLYGRGIYDRGTVQFEARDSASIDDIGEHGVTFDMPYQDDDDVGQGAANYILNKYSSAFAQARSITVVADSSALVTQILARDISDRLTVSETVTGLNSHYFINGEELTVLASGHVQATYTLVPAADPFTGLYWILGTSTLGTNTIPAPF